LLKSYLDNLDLLHSYISLLSKEDIRHFKSFLERNADVKTRKDFELFDYILKNGEKYNEEHIFKKLYTFETDKNNYYRLKNRLITEISKSLTLQYFNENITNELFNSINIALLAIQKRKTDLAYRVLLKAEKKANTIANLELLDIIYTQIISISNDIISIPIDEYVEKRSKNLRKLENVRKIDDTLSIISHQLRISQNYSNESDDVVKLLEKHLKKFNNEEIEANNYALRIKIFEAASKILLQKHDFKKLEEYIKTSYKQFDELKIFTKEKHNLKLQMLTYLSNALFKNRKYEESLSYAQILFDSMKEFDNLHYDKYLIFYYNILIINYSELDKNKAIDILESIRNEKEITQSSFFYFILLNLSLLYFKQKEYRIALKNLLKLYTNEIFRKSSNALKTKISLLELIIRVELKDNESFDYRYKQIKKEFGNDFLDSELLIEKALFDILKMFSDNNFVMSEAIKKASQEFLKSAKIPESQQDSQIIDYKTWLKEKVNFKNFEK
jgi:hypothetical protein